jgi:hypothetical protein
MTDADCLDAGQGLICDMPCTCFHGGAKPGDYCTPGCATDADCGPSMTCSAHKCGAAACTVDADCTANFHCASATKTCAPKPCTMDSDCSGYCVLGACSPILGGCALAVP